MSLTLEARAGTPGRNGGAKTGAAEPIASTTPAYQVIRRNGAVTPFDAAKITIAVTKAFLAVEGGRAAASRRVHEVVEELTGQVVAALKRRGDTGRTFHIEEIQDQVELALMRGEHHKVARAYVLYREERAKQRAATGSAQIRESTAPSLTSSVRMAALHRWTTPASCASSRRPARG